MVALARTKLYDLVTPVFGILRTAFLGTTVVGKPGELKNGGSLGAAKLPRGELPFWAVWESEPFP